MSSLLGQLPSELIAGLLEVLVGPGVEEGDTADTVHMPQSPQ